MHVLVPDPCVLDLGNEFIVTISVPLVISRIMIKSPQSFSVFRLKVVSIIQCVYNPDLDFLPHWWVCLKVPWTGTQLSCRGTWAMDSCKSQMLLSVLLKALPKDICRESAFGGIVCLELRPSFSSPGASRVVPSDAHIWGGINLHTLVPKMKATMYICPPSRPRPSKLHFATLAEESCASEPLSELASKVINFFTTADEPAKFGLITYDCAKLECFIGEVLRICNKQFLRKIQNRPHWGLLRSSYSASKVSIF